MRNETPVRVTEKRDAREQEQRFPDCGHPMVLAELTPGERVLELGCGSGVDCLLAAKLVGPHGEVVGVDGSPTSLARARSHVDLVRAGNISFRLAELEHLPLRDDGFDVVLSNGALSFLADPRGASHEAARVMRPGGRFAAMEVLATRLLPPGLRRDLEATGQPTARVSTVSDLEEALARAGFHRIEHGAVPESSELMAAWQPAWGLRDFLTLVRITAHKAVRSDCPNGCCWA